MNPSISRMATLFLIFLFGSALLVSTALGRTPLMSPVAHYVMAE